MGNDNDLETERQHINRLAKEWRTRNPEKVKVYRKRQNRERIREMARAWNARNPEKIKEYKKREYQRHREEIRQRNKAYYEANRDRLIQQQRQWYKDNASRIRENTNAWRKANRTIVRMWTEKNRKKRRAAYMLYGVRKSAKEKNLPFDLTIEWLDERLKFGLCELSGLPFDMEAKRGANSPSVDKIDPSKGYVQANCRVILWSLNRAKSNYSEEYFISIMEAVVNRKKRRQIEIPHLGRVA